MASIRKQIHDNAVALISLFIAVTGLAYNTWRNETSEEQRNIRHAAFTVLEDLGSMQEVADANYYFLAQGKEVGNESELHLRGWGSVLMARDLMSLMPEPAPVTGEMLRQTWIDHFSALDDVNAQGRRTARAGEAKEAIDIAIKESRETVLMVIKSLE
ncbi:MAG TPA: hypothetical protein VJ984_16570 [Xanthomonadales bacterium]|nr:hypothetical protein [Xanthomonadales bacterium]